MSAMAQALSKAGLVDKEKADQVNEERNLAQKKYIETSRSISELIRVKKDLRRLGEEIKSVKVPPSTKDVLRAMMNLDSINLEHNSNKTLVLNKINEELESAEKLLKPLIQASRKLEKVWGFKRLSKKPRF